MQNHLYVISFTVGAESGLALVAANDEKSAFQILKNGGSRHCDGYSLIQTRDIGMTCDCYYGLLMESFVNARQAYDAIMRAANKLVGPKGDKGDPGDSDAVMYVEQSLTDEQKGQARSNIGAGTYSKPLGGIPASDLAGDAVSNNVFYAVFGTTVLSEVRAEVASGKLVYTIYDGNIYEFGYDDGACMYFYTINTDEHALHEIGLNYGGWNYLSSTKISTIDPGRLKTNLSTSQPTSASESLGGTINLHKISKTGSYADLLNKPVLDRSWSFDVSGISWQLRRINISFTKNSGNSQCVYLVEAHSGDNHAADFSALVKFDWIGAPAECYVISGNVSRFEEYPTSYWLSIDFSSLSYFEGIVRVSRITNLDVLDWGDSINVGTGQSYIMPGDGDEQAVKYLLSDSISTSEIDTIMAS